jgi:hypothetical protein
MRTGEPAQFLVITVVAGGALADRRWEHATMALIRKVKDAKLMISAPIRLGVQFQIPGEVLRPKLNGLRVHRFDEDEELLEIWVGLPSQPLRDADREIRDYLALALKTAEEFARSHGISERLTALQELVAEL